MKILLTQGDELVVEFEDTDGQFKIVYGLTNLQVHSDLEDSTGRVGVIYDEQFNTSEDAQVVAPPGREVDSRLSMGYPIVKEKKINEAEGITARRDAMGGVAIIMNPPNGGQVTCVYLDYRAYAKLVAMSFDLN